jgi:hypothetical protein
MKVPCSAQRIVEDGPWDVQVILVSASAIRIHARQMFRPGMHVAVDLPAVSGSTKAHLFRVTQGKERIGTLDWIVEGPFFQKLTAEELTAAQRRLATASRNPAAPGWTTKSRRVRVKEEGPWLVTVQNVSHRGIGLVTDRRFEPGVVLKIELPSILRKHLAPRLVRVSHSAALPDGAGWATGGVFLRELTEEELQVLL